MVRSFGDPEPVPESEFRPTPPPAGTVEIAVRFVVDRESLAVLGHQLASVVSAAVQDGIAEGVEAARRSPTGD